MVAAELVCAGECLREGDVGGRGGVYFDGRGARCGQNLVRCHGEREDVGDVSFEMLAWTGGGGVA